MAGASTHFVSDRPSALASLVYASLDLVCASDPIGIATAHRLPDWQSGSRSTSHDGIRAHRLLGCRTFDGLFVGTHGFGTLSPPSSRQDASCSSSPQSSSPSRAVCWLARR